MKETLPKSVQELILSLREKLKDEPEIVDMFERCYSNTLDTTVKKMEDGSTYVITGDIPAMWLRDSVYDIFFYQSSIQVFCGIFPITCKCHTYFIKPIIPAI